MHFDTHCAQNEGVNPALRLIQRFVSAEPSEDLERGSSRQSRSDFMLPGASEHDGQIQFPEQARSGAGQNQLLKAEAMHRHGLRSKARRQASCSVYARVRCCENGHQHFQTYFCKNRYCPNEACGRRAFLNLFNKYLGLDSAAAQIVPDWQNRPRRKPRLGDFVIAKIDITIRNMGRMPTPIEIRKFNADVRRLFRDAEQVFGLTYPKRVKVDGHMVPERPLRAGDYGVLWTDEFGGRANRVGKAGNTNLHAHAIYCGPFISQKWLSERWAAIRADGSRIVSIKVARTFRAGLYHALKYAGKFLSSDPHRLAELEVAFNRVRRVHTIGGFYNAISQTQPQAPSPCCPECGGTMFDPTGPLRPVRSLEALGIRDFDLVRREIGRKKIIEGSPG